MLYKKIIYLLIVVAFSLFPLLSKAAQCDTIVAQIYEDIVSQSQNWVWKDLTWLQNNLGASQSEVVKETLYQWPKFSLLVRGSMTYKSVGEEPLNKRGLPSLEEVTKVLGQPISSLTNEQGKQYSWSCVDTKSRLILKTNLDDTWTSVEVLTCPNQMMDSCKATGKNWGNALKTPAEKQMDEGIVHMKIN